MKIMERYGVRSAWAAVVMAGAGSLAIFAPTAAAATVNPATGHETIGGVITALGDDSLTVDHGDAIAISAATACTHDGQTMLMADLDVGDRVSVELFRDPATGHQQAILIEVLSQAHAAG